MAACSKLLYSNYNRQFARNLLTTFNVRLYFLSLSCLILWAVHETAFIFSSFVVATVSRSLNLSTNPKKKKKRK